MGMKGRRSIIYGLRPCFILGRRGLILASLTKLKQICNHPDQYLGQDVYAVCQRRWIGDCYE